MAAKTAAEKAAAVKKAAAAKKVGATVVPKEIEVTQAYFDEHKDDLEAAGVAVGDTIENPDYVEPEADEAVALSILNGDEYIRTYKAEDAALAEQFCSKVGRELYKSVPETSVVKVTVTYDVTDKTTQVVSQVEKEFTAETDGPDFKDGAIVFKNENRGFIKATLAK